jgi:cobalt-zinc-cadmium efflux system outer membrane protein
VERNRQTDASKLNTRRRNCSSVLVLMAAMLAGLGCASSHQQVQPSVPPMPARSTARSPEPVVVPASFRSSPVAPSADLPQPHHALEVLPVVLPPMHETLADLEGEATANNPALRRMQQEAAAEWARVGYANKLPDPTVGGMFFGNAMNFVPDRQLAEVQVMQMIPWLGRLRAEVQQAQMEALAAESMYQAERLRVMGDLRAAWFRLYVLGKQIATAEAEKAQIQALISTANARIATGNAQPGDVLMATLEFSNLQEQLIGLRQQVVATSAEINRLAGRDSRVPVGLPQSIEAEFPTWNHDLLREIAMQAQPELAAARLRVAATRAGIDVAQLKRRPDVSLGASWMVMAADPGDTMPGAGDDAWTLNVTTSLPIWHHKYDAIASEASRRHFAAHASEDEVALRLDALLRDLWEQAVASQQTVELYETTILPQARQTFEADQQSLANNTVTFDRVIRDYRTLLNLELGYHRALGQLATSLARIRQTVGVDLLNAPENN